jgi:dCTP deaminase
MVLSDRDILNSLGTEGGIKIDGLQDGAIQPCSVDLHLGRSFLQFKGGKVIDLGSKDREVDMIPVRPDMDGRVTIFPQQFLLGVTMERIRVPLNMVARLEGKSSLGRLGLIVHATAGFIDAGNELNITLELYNMSPNIYVLHPGMAIAQIAFQEMKSPCKVPYGPKRGSRYFGSSTVEASRIHENAFGGTRNE